MKYLMPVCLVASLLLSACATTREYEEKISGWIGHTVDDLYSALGVPTSTQPQPDGGSIVTYERKEVVKAVPESNTTQLSVPGSSNPSNGSSTSQAKTGAATTANTRIVSCTTRYKTDSTGVIRSWTFDGNGCKAVEEPAPQKP